VVQARHLHPQIPWGGIRNENKKHTVQNAGCLRIKINVTKISQNCRVIHKNILQCLKHNYPNFLPSSLEIICWRYRCLGKMIHALTTFLLCTVATISLYLLLRSFFVNISLLISVSFRSSLRFLYHATKFVCSMTLVFLYGTHLHLLSRPRI
jgi:hypothetical protein